MRSWSPLHAAVCRAVGSLGIATASACSDPGPDLPELTIHSERADIGLGVGYAHDPPCRGDLDRIDRQIERVESYLGVTRPERLEIYLMPTEGICRDDAIACYAEAEDVIFANWSSLPHEIVHAVAREIPFPSLFWSEGTAEFLSRATKKNSIEALEPSDLEAEELTNYVSAAHVARFVVETYGWDAFRRVIRGDPLEQALGVSAAALTERYEAEAPAAYPPLIPCEFPALPQLDDAHWREEVAFDCDDPDVSTNEYDNGSDASRPALLRSVALDAGTYELALDGEHALAFVVLGCHTEVLDEIPELPSNGDLYNEIDGASGTKFPEAGRHVVEVTAGSYRIALLGSGGGDDDLVTFTIERLD